MMCPQCGGSEVRSTGRDGEVLGVEWYRCDSQRMLMVPSGAPPGGANAMRPLYQLCGHEFLGPSSSAAGRAGLFCDCGLLAVGVCRHCSKLLCNRHAVSHDDKVACSTCASPEGVQARAEIARRKAKQAADAKEQAADRTRRAAEDAARRAADQAEIERAKTLPVATPQILASWITAGTPRLPTGIWREHRVAEPNSLDVARAMAMAGRPLVTHQLVRQEAGLFRKRIRSFTWTGRLIAQYHEEGEDRHHVGYGGVEGWTSTRYSRDVKLYADETGQELLFDFGSAFDSPRPQRLVRPIRLSYVVGAIHDTFHGWA